VRPAAKEGATAVTAVSTVQGIKAASNQLRGTMVVALGVRGMMSIAFPILVSGGIALVAARRSDHPRHSRS
jgi:hypothetical protein